MEAIRVRGIANGDLVGEMGLRLDDFELGVAVAAVETGTLNRCATLLIQAGFNSRLAAIKAVTEAQAGFSNVFELQRWLSSDLVLALTARTEWPTVETHDLWKSFSDGFKHQENKIWKEQRFWSEVQWDTGLTPDVATPVRVFKEREATLILSDDGLRLGVIPKVIVTDRREPIRAFRWM